jgi:triosephosphate isomerase
MRRPPFLLGSSFKMNKTRAELRAYADALRGARLPDPAEASLFLIPPFTGIDALKAALGGLPVLVGAQTCGPAAAGAFTGEVSAAMLAEAGCDLVELGHSERRAMFGETDAAVAAKARLVLDQGMRPLVCVGEDAAARASGEAVGVVEAQARAAFATLAPGEASRCWLAYEPVWAIGVGARAARVEDVRPVHAALKAAFPDMPLLYGGSVDMANAPVLAAEPLVEGLFVGRAALDPDAFLAIVGAALAARRGLGGD